MLYRVGVCLMILYGAASGRAGGPGSLIGFAGGILLCWGVLGVGCSVLYSTMIAERHDPDPASAAISVYSSKSRLDVICLFSFFFFALFH